MTAFALNADGGFEIRVHRQGPADRNHGKQEESASEINRGERQRSPLKSHGIESGEDGQGQREQGVQSYDELIEAFGVGLHLRTRTNDAGIRAHDHRGGDGYAASIPGKVDPGAQARRQCSCPAKARRNPPTTAREGRLGESA